MVIEIVNQPQHSESEIRAYSARIKRLFASGHCADRALPERVLGSIKHAVPVVMILFDLLGRFAALVLVCLLLAGRSVEAQPTVFSTAPTAAFVNAPATANVTATFSEAVTGGAAATFVVHSALSGQQAGAYSGNNSTTLTFNPTTDFFPGETVFSTLTSVVQATSGISMTTGHVWQFTTEVSASSPGEFHIGAASDVSADAHTTRAVSFGDVDADGDLDLIAGNNGANRLYTGDGSGDFGSGADITSDAHATYSTSVGDTDGDGDLDLIAGNYNQINRLYL
ncbi:MAG: FG-GAP-like repeat-containing protein, partial [Candidatus Latescibacteria bacterium]|nr:FG-GAP-like repeat-containing protein [Candidatus Latescibacterota bacterium]